jgi:hypothetical protein
VVRVADSDGCLLWVRRVDAANQCLLGPAWLPGEHRAPFAARVGLGEVSAVVACALPAATQAMLQRSLT